MVNIKQKIKSITWGLAFAGLISSPLSFAMTVKPMHIEMQSAGKHASSKIIVINEGASPLPVEVVMEKLVMDETGATELFPEDNQWLVFPPQTVIPGGGTQSFRLQWLGDPALQSSESFFAVVKQVPVEKEIGESGVQVVYNFKSLVNVAPIGSQPKILAEDVTIKPDGKGNQRFALRVKNPTQIHGLLSQVDVQLVAIDINTGKEIWDTQISREQIRSGMGIGLVQPGLSREFLLPAIVPEKVMNGGISLEARLVTKK